MDVVGVKEFKMRTVHVVYKTHLDIGFTDYAENVLEKYRKSFIPKAIELAEQANVDQLKFVWTTGSYLIYDYIQNCSDEEKIKFEDAINKGYINWHGLPFTMHSELLDSSLFNYGLEYSKWLDSKFNKKTIAAKMTDVPGHTKAIIKLLKESGIEYLHLGVNPASKMPNVPTLFRWQHEDHEIIVNYADGYGKDVVVDGFDHILHFAHTADNLGPPTKEELEKQLDEIKLLYPEAKVIASTLDAYAAELLSIKNQLPVVTEEIGDTWIHGVGTDPQKVGLFLELSRLRKQWIKEGVDFNSINEFSENLLLIAEHTWGMDHKLFMLDTESYKLADFREARLNDTIDVKNNSLKTKYISNFSLEQEAKHLGSFDTSYSIIEESWREQNSYLKKAITSLPNHLKDQAFQVLDQKRISIISGREQLKPYTLYDIKGFKDVSFNYHGAIDQMVLNGEKVCDAHHVIGEFSYEIFDYFQYEKFEKEYNDNYHLNYMWSDADFTKPGLEFTNIKNQIQKCYLDNISLNKCETYDEVICDLKMPVVFIAEFGAFEMIQLTYRFYEDQMAIELNIFNKEASRIPEAMWLKISPIVDNEFRWEMSKMDTMISPFFVVKNGNRNMHSVEFLEYVGTEKYMKIRNLDSPLVSLGDRKLLNIDNEVTLKNGMYYNLANNIWGTNFPAWNEGDMKFRFEIHFDH